MKEMKKMNSKNNQEQVHDLALDIGCSGVKAVWEEVEMKEREDKKNGEKKSEDKESGEKNYQFLSVAYENDDSFDLFCMALPPAERCYLVGFGNYELLKEKFSGTEISKITAHQIFSQGTSLQERLDAEIEMQAAGAKKLLQIAGHPCNDFLLVSLGTGISYASVTPEKNIHLGGSPLGGKHLSVLSELLGIKNFPTSMGDDLDLRMKDQLPETAGTFLGELVIGHFAKFSGKASPEQIYRSLVNEVAVGVYKEISRFPEQEKVVYVGATHLHHPLLSDLLGRYTQALGKTPLFVADGEYALALGIYESREREGWKELKLP